MNYQTEISESGDYLIELERATKDLKARDRVRFIRLLKTGRAATQKQAGVLIGLQVRQAQRLWEQYREQGLAVMCQNNYTGGMVKLDGTAQAGLKARLKQDDMQSLEQVRLYLEQEFGVGYTVSGISRLFKRLKVKLKTGRPANIKQDKEQMEEFAKKNIRP
jgi:transposase